MQHLFSLLLTTLVGKFFAYSQIAGPPLTASYLKSACYSSFHPDVFGFLNNPAILGSLKHAGAGIHSERRFLLKELTQYNLAVAFQTSLGNFGIVAGQFGNQGFRESKWSVAHGRSLGPRVDLGVQFNVEKISIPGYASSSAITAKAGILLHLTGSLHAGLHILNPAGAKFGSYNREKYPSIYTAGFGYEPSNKLLFVLEFIKQDHFSTNIEVSIQYQFHHGLWARTGVSTANTSRWLGWGASWKNLRADLVVALHPYLGLSTGLVLIVEFHRHKKNDVNKDD